MEKSFEILAAFVMLGLLGIFLMYCARSTFRLVAFFRSESAVAKSSEEQIINRVVSLPNGGFILRALTFFVLMAIGQTAVLAFVSGDWSLWKVLVFALPIVMTAAAAGVWWAVQDSFEFRRRLRGEGLAPVLARAKPARLLESGRAVRLFLPHLRKARLTNGKTISLAHQENSGGSCEGYVIRLEFKKYPFLTAKKRDCFISLDDYDVLVSLASKPEAFSKTS